jgi:hypothetical protein
VTGLQGQASVTARATAEAAYALVSDVTRTGEWSPVCERVEWADGSDGPAVGARFTGHNRDGKRTWSVDAVVEKAEPGRAFAFHTVIGGAPRTRWSYRVEPAPAGCTITESYERLVTPPLLARLLERLVVGDRKAKNDGNIRASLERIKGILEAG